MLPNRVRNAANLAERPCSAVGPKWLMPSAVPHWSVATIPVGSDTYTVQDLSAALRQIQLRPRHTVSLARNLQRANSEVVLHLHGSQSGLVYRPWISPF